MCSEVCGTIVLAILVFVFRSFVGSVVGVSILEEQWLQWFEELVSVPAVDVGEDYSFTVETESEPIRFHLSRHEFMAAVARLEAKQIEEAALVSTWIFISARKRYQKTHLGHYP